MTTLGYVALWTRGHQIIQLSNLEAGPGEYEIASNLLGVPKLRLNPIPSQVGKKNLEVRKTELNGFLGSYPPKKCQEKNWVYYICICLQTLRVGAYTTCLHYITGQRVSHHQKMPASCSCGIKDVVDVKGKLTPNIGQTLVQTSWVGDVFLLKDKRYC